MPEAGHVQNLRRGVCLRALVCAASSSPTATEDTLKVQMKSAVDSLPLELLENDLGQATRRGALLQMHRERVAAGRPSILLGLRSFGEGMDCQLLCVKRGS